MIDPQIPQNGEPTLTPRILRQFAVIWLLFFFALAVWQSYMHGHTNLAAAFAATGASVGAVGLIRPTLIRPLYKGMVILTYPIGWVVSHLLLGVLYYCVFTPVGLLFRLFGRDALALRRRDQQTYWSDKPMPTDVRQYFKQF